MDYKEKVIALLNDQELSKEQKEKLENIFPELQESEDERIRTAIIRILKGETGYISKEDTDRYITWLENQGEFDDNIITRDDEILQAISVGLTDVVEDAGWSDFGGIPIEEIQDWLEKQGSPNTFEVPETSIKDAEEVTSRMQHIEDDMRPIAEFIINYANWNLHKDEWNQPTLTVPLFRVLDALIQRGKPYGECVQNIEKQGEKKPVDKVEPKFKAGNWYQCTKNFFGKGVTFDKNTAYYCAIEGCLLDGCHIAIVKDLYDNFKLWTIQDAKDGDVLLEEETGEPFIYNGNRATYFSGYFLGAYCGIYNGEFNPYGNIHHWGKNSCPATKEQRDLLFQKMKEAGYEWDSEKKELKKIEPEFEGDNILSTLGNNQVQDILEDMGLLDDNGRCPHTAEEIFKAGMEHAFNLNREAASSVKLDAKNR